MNYIVFDLEWNQCPDGKKKERPDLPFEILEIGALKLNEKKEEIDRFHEYIRPTVYDRLHPKTGEIVHISQKTLLSSDRFPVVIDRFFRWCGEDARYCTWGSLDLLELQRNMRFHHVPDCFPFPLKYYDIQKLFSLSFEDGKSRRTLEYAVDMLRLEKTVPFHEALSDAWYTSAVMRCLDDSQVLPFFSIDYFTVPHKRKEEIYTVFPERSGFPSYSKFVSKEFSSKTELMRDRKVVSTRCYICGRHAKKKIRWFLSSGKNYTCLACCEEHGYLKGKIRLKKTEDGGGFFCVKTLKLIDDTQAQMIYSRQEVLRERKRIRRHLEKEREAEHH